MARISTYPVDTNITNTDLLLGTDSETGAPTVNYTIASISGKILYRPTVTGLVNYADDAAAAAGGVPINGLYHTVGAIKIRLV